MKHALLSKREIHILLLCAGIAVAIAAFYLLADAGIGIGCPFFQITGLQCPGCGNSRAAMALLRGDLSVALRYNMLFPLEFLYIIWVFIHGCYAYLKNGRFSYRTPCRWLDAGVLAVVVIWGIVRNFL